MRRHVLPFLLFSIPLTVMADHGSVNLNTNSAAPIATESGITLPANKWSVGLRTEYIKSDGYLDDELVHLREADEEGDLHSTKELWTYSAGVSYGVTDDFTIGIRLPFIYRTGIREPAHGHHGEVEETHHEEEEVHEEAHHEDEEEHHEEEEHHVEEEVHQELASITNIADIGDVEGIGDITVFGQYRFFHQNDLSASVILGVKMPTGKTNRKSAEGTEILETEFQPGSGSWDGILGLAFTQQIEAFSLDSSFVYNVTSEGAQDTDLGDVFSYNFAASYSVIGNHSMSLMKQSDFGLDVVMEINGEWRDYEETRGIRDGNSGGNVVYFSPGIRFKAKNLINAGISVGIPFIQDMNGNQTEPDFRIIGNIGFSF